MCSGSRHRKTEEDGRMYIQAEYIPRRNGREQDYEKGPSSLQVGDVFVLRLKVIENVIFCNGWDGRHTLRV